MPANKHNPHAAMRGVRKMAAEDRLTRIAREHLAGQVQMARDIGVREKDIGVAILRGALNNPTGNPEER